MSIELLSLVVGVPVLFGAISRRNSTLRASARGRMAFRCMAIAIVAIGALVGRPASSSVAVTLGQQERTDWSGIQGWACDTRSSPAKKTDVFLFTHLHGVWTQIGSAPANRYRADVAATGVCGGGAYHGFVFSDLPQSIVDGDIHDIHVFAYSEGPGMVPLGGSPQPLETAYRGLWDAGLENGAWRTDYPSPLLGTPAAPLSMDQDAAGKCYLWKEPHYLMAGASFDAYKGPEHDCLASPSTFAQSNAASSEAGHVVDNFWVVTVNVEKAFDNDSPCTTGPPNQSVPISPPGGGLASLVTLPDFEGGQFYRKRAHLILNTVYENCGKIPFISYGAQSGFGNGGGGPITVLRVPGAPTELNFGATLLEISPDASQQNAAYVFIEAIWGGRKRWAYLYLLGRNLGASLDSQRFNWNIRESVWFPGADIVYRDLRHLNAECASTPGWTPPGEPLSPAQTTQDRSGRRSYVINLESLFACLGPSRFTEPIPPSGPIPITGIHFAIEQGPSRNNWTHVAFDGVVLATARAAARR